MCTTFYDRAPHWISGQTQVQLASKGKILHSLLFLFPLISIYDSNHSFCVRICMHGAHSYWIALSHILQYWFVHAIVLIASIALKTLTKQINSLQMEVTKAASCRPHAHADTHTHTHRRVSLLSRKNMFRASRQLTEPALCASKWTAVRMLPLCIATFGIQ